MRSDKLTQPRLDRLLSFGSQALPAEHEDLVVQYVLWYGLNVTVWFALKGYDVERPVRMREFRHYLDAVGFPCD